MNLSIIVVNWNTEKLLMQCINSLVSSLPAGKAGIKYQACLPARQVLSIEIIVVDNGSTDGSVNIVKEYIIHNTKYLIHLIENKENLGFAKAVNQGIKSSSGESILLLNSDIQVNPGALKKLIEFEKLVRPAVIGARMLNPDGTIQGSCFCLPTVKRATLEYWLGRKNYFSKYAPQGKEPVEVEAVSGGAMLISRELIDKIGMLDERYFMYYEDLDYCRRARRAGFKIYYLPTVEIVHEHGVSGRNLAKENEQWKRLIPSSKIYHGSLKHYAITFIIKIGQKWQKFIK